MKNPGAYESSVEIREIIAMADDIADVVAGKNSSKAVFAMLGLIEQIAFDTEASRDFQKMTVGLLRDQADRVEAGMLEADEIH